MEINKFTRKSFEIEAVQVTEENFQEVSIWCSGVILSNASGEKYIKVRVHYPITQRQTQAFIGDWVLYSGKGFKVYTDNAFNRQFVPTNVDGLSSEAAVSLAKSKLASVDQNVFEPNSVPAEELLSTHNYSVSPKDQITGKR